MSDSELLVSALARLALLRPEEQDRPEMLHQLMGTATDVLALSGVAVTLIEEGRFEVAGAKPRSLVELEAAQQDCARGPRVDALRWGESVAVPDVRKQWQRWPEYTSAALRHGVSAMAEIPMQLGDTQVGALGVYAVAPREWTAEEMSLGALLAGMAAGHLLTADKLRRQQRLTDQLQHALNSRIVVEQAKGVIAGTQHIGPEVAYEMIRAHARQRRIAVHEVARAIVELGLRL